MSVEGAKEQENAQRWLNEYAKPGMPSSFRQDPSGSVIDFAQYLRAQDVQSGNLLDIGFGKGRNSLYLAGLEYDVYGIEMVPALVADIVERSAELGLSEHIHPICHSATSRLPYDEGSFAAAVDTFCYKHQVDQDDRLTYRRELIRVLKPGGFFLLTLADVDDGYYGPLLSSDREAGTEAVITDPIIGVQSVLYTREAIVNDFGPPFKLERYDLKVKDGVMYGDVYLRKTHVFTFVRERCDAFSD
jgi:SAM-dependent methyltransferase